MRVTENARYSEDLRQLEHFAPIGFAFLIRYLAWPQALALASLAVIYGILSPRLWPATRRPDEAEKRFSPGKVAYAVAVFCLVLFFPDRKFIVVAVWANLSVGDAVSNVVGRHFGRSPLPWNRSKTWVGVLSAVVGSTAAAWALIVWTGLPQADAIYGRAFWFALATSIACSLCESLPLPVDDNLTICASGALFLSWLSQASLPGSFDGSQLVLATGVSFAVGALALASRAVSGGAFVAGALIGSAVFYGFGPGGFVVLGLFFVLGTVFTRLGYARKERMGAAEPHASRRSAAHVWGKGVAAFLASVCSVFLQDKSPAALAFVAAVAAALYDTTATELGLLAGRRAFLLNTLRVNTLRAVPRGTRGAVSVAGSALGFLAAIVIVVAAYLFGLVGIAGMLKALVAASIASHLESWAASRPQGSSVGGPMMNAFHTASAMLLAAAMARTGA